MSDNTEKKEPRRYYNFSRLLKADISLDRALVVRSSSASDIKDAMIRCVVDTFVMLGDNIFDNDVKEANKVAGEREIDEIVSMLKLSPSINELASHINSKLSIMSRSRGIYTELFDFELELIRQKLERLTLGKSAL